MDSKFIHLIWPYMGWAAAILLAVAVLSALSATTIALPLLLLVAAGGLAYVRYRDEIKTFDFWALDEWIRTRHEALGIREWYAPYQAAERFCSPVIVKARNEAAAEMNSVMMQLVRQPGHRASAGLDFASTADSARRGNSDERNHTHYEAAQVRFGQCNNALSRELRNQLVQGTLFAKGLPIRSEVTLAERVIPTSRWRVMTLDIVRASASGPGLSYNGLVIGKKPALSKAPAPQGLPPETPPDRRA